MECSVTLASCSSPCSAPDSSDFRCVCSSSSRIRSGSASVCWKFGLNRRSLDRFWPLRAVFFASEVHTTVRRTRRKNAGAAFNVELEIFKFMQQSGKPNEFPSKEELIAAGRSDLVEAALKRGGWLTLGWESDKPKAENSPENGHFPLFVNGASKSSSHNGSSNSCDEDKHRLDSKSRKSEIQRPPPAELILRKESSVSYSNNTEQIAAHEVTSKGLDGPISEASLLRSGARRRQPGDTIEQKEISKNHELPSAEASHERWRRKRRKETRSAGSDNTSVKNALDWIHDMVQRREQWILESMSKPSKQIPGAVKNETPPTSLTGKFTKDASPSRRSSPTDASATKDFLRTDIAPTSRNASFRTDITKESLTANTDPTTRRALTDFTKEPFTTSTVSTFRRASSETFSTEASVITKPSSATGIVRKESSAGTDSFNTRLRKLEAKLLATRAALKSGRATLLKGEDKLLQVQRKTLDDLGKAADSLEFREDDIIQTRAELRKSRAQVVALQAKMALELSEARKATEEKQMLLDRAEKALKMMRLVRIVWPNPASHVLLTGSFDGWTNKIKMEKSSAGVFVTALHLYPGRYEVKFVVDGTWRVDACRPITYADGIENNVLMVS